MEFIANLWARQMVLIVKAFTGHPWKDIRKNIKLYTHFS